MLHLVTLKNVKLSLPTWFRQVDCDRLHRAFKHRGKVHGYFNPAAKDIAFTEINSPGKFAKTDSNKQSHFFSEFKIKEGYISASLTIIDNEFGRSLMKEVKSGRAYQRRRMLNDPWYSPTKNDYAPGFFAIDFITE